MPLGEMLMVCCGTVKGCARLQPLFSPAKEAKSVILSCWRVPKKRQECWFTFLRVKAGDSMTLVPYIYLYPPYIFLSSQF